ncbi:hypothetical protein HMF7854_04230 [Sphingomonas ginkgonis]|uniref:Uncharacterized protein n=1 Tax=Sphingomonas ginkgonis TaxID=2315330 RepID=A0A429V849_9SPHN|nr:hypothetical protein HMF7854_04230 [Sphingomonas ginkgonis]
MALAFEAAPADVRPGRCLNQSELFLASSVGLVDEVRDIVEVAVEECIDDFGVVRAQMEQVVCQRLGIKLSVRRHLSYHDVDRFDGAVE